MGKQILTIEQAKAQGYIYAVDENSDGQLVKLDNCVVGKKYYLATKEGSPFRIAKDLIMELVDDWLTNQDEVADEDGKLNDLAADVDYSDITNKINEAFSKTNYYYSTGIYLQL